MEFDNLDSRPGKSWNFGPGHGKSWNLMLAKCRLMFCIVRNVCGKTLENMANYKFIITKRFPIPGSETVLSPREN